MYGRFTTTQLQKYAQEQGARLRREQQQKEQQQAEDEFRNYDDSCLSYFKSEYIKFVLYIYLCRKWSKTNLQSYFVSLPLWQRGVSYSYEKFGWEAGMVSRLCSKKNCREPLGLNLKNPGCILSIWFLCKNGDFLVSHEEKLATTGHQVLLEYSPGWT